MGDIQYLYKYKLQLDNKGFKVFDDDPKIIVQNGVNKVVSYSNIKMGFSLYGVTFNRKVYEPGRIQAEMLIESTDDTIPSVDLLTQMLIRRPVALLVVKCHYDTSGALAVDKTEIVAQNYYIHEISPQFEKGTTTEKYIDDDGIEQEKSIDVNWIYIKLDIFSLDKLLTLQKYSQAHFGRELFGDILKENKDSFPLRFETTDVTTTTSTISITTETRKLYHLGYITKNKDGKDYQAELIQPYLVQYNESFYDFLRRTANRCGEMFYFENGKLCIGVPTGDAAEISDAYRIVFQRISEGPITVRDYARDSLKQWDDENKTYEPEDGKILSDPVAPDKDGFPSDAFPKIDETCKYHPYAYNSEIASEDHYMMLFKNKFARDSVQDLWCGDDGEHVMRTVQLVLSSTSLMDMLTNFGLREMEAAAKAKAKAEKTTKKMNEVVSNGALNSGDTYIVTPKVDKDRDNHWITLNYVKDIRDNEEAQTRKMICIDMGKEFRNVKLGDKIKLPSPNDLRTYVVVQVDMSSEEAWQRTYEGFVDGGGTKPISGASQRFYAIPMTEKDVFFPPLLPGNPFRQAGPQPAFVIDSSDPVRQGRVRIRFPWQPHYESSYSSIEESDLQNAVNTAQEELETARTELEEYADEIIVPEKGVPTARKKEEASQADYDSALKNLEDKLDNYRAKVLELEAAKTKHLIEEAGSPWIRMASPMATSGGGMFFCPEKGDEVMVDFENGNVERPYVTGALYSKNVPAPKEGGRVIVSKNGHTIRMSDPSDGLDLLAGLFPAIKLLKGYGAFDDSKIEMKNGTIRALGGIELTDQLGFYNIRMSSHDRLINISSPFGDVNISALTGISIDAPNGNISITGKNVDISAYNKVTINSGKNINLSKDKHRAAWFCAGEDAGELGKHLGKSVPKLFGVGKLFDLTLIRTLLEIFIRPIDGALEIKSERFLLLEAGGHTASGEVTDYNVKPIIDPLMAVHDSDILHELLKYIGASVGTWQYEFTTKFNAFWNVMRPLIRYWKDRPRTADRPRALGPMISRPNRNDFLHDIFNNAFDKIPDDLDMTHALSQINKNLVFATDAEVTAEVKNAFKGAIEDVLLSASSLKQHMATFDHMLDGIKDASFIQGKRLRLKAEYRIKDLWQDAQAILSIDNPIVDPGVAVHPPGTTPDYANMATGAAPNTGLYAEVIKPVRDFIAGQGNDRAFSRYLTVRGDNLKWQSAVERRIACMVIEKCRETRLFKGFVIPKAKYPLVNGQPTAPDNLKYPFSDADWTKYINGIQMEMPTSSETWYAKLGTGVWGGIKNMLWKIVPWESDTWSSEKSGKIYFSDTKGKSYRFSDAGPTEVVPNTTKAEADLPKIKMRLRTF